ncbi:MAG: SPOR domain-containing protein [Candidatus Marinimicrobia bacterium]|nr:SPOR domain-containing protein [Candidatus Neomarinimicrobiota bacterium]MBL7110125.1 SPOR domain-containing protein [Candidatus Neomarinimicrobiota bacterium]
MKLRFIFSTAIILLISLVSLTLAQDVDFYIKSALAGKTEIAQKSFLELEDMYPNDPGVMFLKGLLEKDGEKAKDIFAKVFNRHSNSKYADDSVMRVAEYYYVAGLYIQASDWFQKMPRYYSRSEHIERAIKLYLNSLVIAGDVDTARFYSRVFERQFPKMELPSNIIDIIQKEVSDKPKSEMSNSQKQQLVNNKAFSLQVGAFSSSENAQRIVDKLNSRGFRARIDKITSGNNTLFAVREGYYSSKVEANKIGTNIKSRLDLDTIVIKN